MDKVAAFVFAFCSLFCISYCGAKHLLEHYGNLEYLTPEFASYIFAFLFTIIIFLLMRMYYSDKFCKCGENKSCDGCSSRSDDGFDENE